MYFFSPTQSYLIFNSLSFILLVRTVPSERVFGFRPEHVDINSSASEDAITLKVKVDQPTGSQSLVFANVGDEEICLDVPKSHLLKPGIEFKMSPRLEHIHIFNSETGKRI